MMKASEILAGKLQTTCKLCGKRVAEAPPLHIPIVGNPGAQVESLMKILLTHLIKNHRQELEAGAALLNEFQAFRILSAFEYEDPSMEPRLENIRAAVFQLVRKNSFTDASLEHIVAGFGLDPADADKVNQAMRTVRDACCEMGEFAPTVPAESKIVTV